MIELDVEARLGDFALAARLQAPADGTLALYGRSGSGKTSIVRAIAGLLRPARGRIAVAGSVFFDAEAGVDVPPEKRRLGYVFQDARLFPHLNVARNLRYGFDRAPAGERRIGFDAVVALLGLETLLARAPATLSGGERQRVAVGRALLAQPRALLMDEPLAALDAARKAEVLPYLERLRATTGLPIVYVSHAQDEILRLADRIALIDDGRVRACGPVGEIAARLDLGPAAGRFEAGAVIDAVLARHVPESALSRLEFDTGALEVPALDAAPGAKLRVQIRARDVMIALTPPQGLSARNVIPARIAALQIEDGAFAEVALAAGASILRARVTRASAVELGLREGLAVFAVIKSVAVGRRDAQTRV
ncbi:MAG: molybdenum ABC transporter ATP-binding protein [Azospirillum sp.]|nr:molybdenum ABC transporter ATP-binding protein [Azospirillum sp.]MCA3267040.1 molybdenum ABC transporter ATP-binding protein [Azospirillum sp.]